MKKSVQPANKKVIIQFEEVFCMSMCLHVAYINAYVHCIP